MEQNELFLEPAIKKAVCVCFVLSFRCPPDIKHWHGASPTTAMTHMALTGMKDGKNVTWMEEVSDQQYNAK